MPCAMSGTVETDETFQRESRKGSREWVLHERDPSRPKPPRRRWYEYPKGQPPRPIARAWSEPILGVVDRAGRATLQHITNIRQPTIEAALVPQVAPDAMLPFDGAPQYETIPRPRGMACEVLIAGASGCQGQSPQQHQQPSRPVEERLPQAMARFGNDIPRRVGPMDGRPPRRRSAGYVPGDHRMISTSPTRSADIPSETVKLVLLRNAIPAPRVYANVPRCCELSIRRSWPKLREVGVDLPANAPENSQRVQPLRRSAGT